MIPRAVGPIGAAALLVAALLVPVPVSAQSGRGDGFDGRRDRGAPERRVDEGDVATRRDARPRERAPDPDDYDAGYDEPRAPRSAPSRRAAPAPAPAAPQPDLSPMSNVPLFVGTQPNCNAGEVTTSSNHKNCATRPIGSTVSLQRAGSGAAPLYVGVTAGRNAGIVALQANRASGTGRVIGYMVPAAQGRTKLFVGTGACNAGLVTTSPEHLGCATREIGYTAP